jgi:hypothetical protein
MNDGEIEQVPLVTPACSANPVKEKVQRNCVEVNKPKCSSAAIFPLFPG